MSSELMLSAQVTELKLKVKELTEEVKELKEALSGVSNTARRL